MLVTAITSSKVQKTDTCKRPEGSSSLAIVIRVRLSKVDPEIDIIRASRN